MTGCFRRFPSLPKRFAQLVKFTSCQARKLISEIS